MSASPITQVITDVDVSNPNVASITSTAVISQQRERRRTNQFFIQASGNMGAATTGEIQLEGRLAEGAAWSPVFTLAGARIQLDFANMGAPFHTLLFADVPTLHAQRWVTTNLTPAQPTIRQINAWIIE